MAVSSKYGRKMERRRRLYRGAPLPIAEPESLPHVRLKGGHRWPDEVQRGWAEQWDAKWDGWDQEDRRAKARLGLYYKYKRDEKGRRLLVRVDNLGWGRPKPKTLWHHRTGLTRWGKLVSTHGARTYRGGGKTK